MHHRPYRDERDLALLLNWLSAHARTAYMHAGDLVWWLRKNMLVDPTKVLELFFRNESELQGFVFVDAGSWAVLQGAADLSAAEWDGMVACAAVKAAGELTVQPHEFDTPQVEALKRAGFTPTQNRMLRLEHTAEPSDLVAVPLPSGYRFADMAQGDVRAEARVELHQHVWPRSQVTAEAYRRLQAAPLYRPDLDVMVVTPSGELACYALGWYDPASRTGLMEPVGTHVNFRRQGLGRCLIREMTRRLVVLGGQKVTIGSYERNQAATRLYQSAGYSLNGFWMDFRREGTLDQG